MLYINYKFLHIIKKIKLKNIFKKSILYQAKCYLNLDNIMTTMCGFCISIGICGPHDHWMRTRINGEYKTICPKLLQTICQTCFKKGHTSRYCRTKENQIAKSNLKTNYQSKKKETTISNMWSTLCIESDESNDEDKPYQYKNWADVETDDDELPPLPASWKQ